MRDIVRLEGETLTIDDFVRSLRFMGKFDSLLEEFVRNRVVVLAARKSGIEVSPEEIQERADQLRRVMGLHRAADMMVYLEGMQATVEDFADHVKDMLLHEKQEKKVTRPQAVEEYFKLNSPRFDAVEIAHIVMSSEGAAKEILALVEDDPSEFGALAAEHSMADTKYKGGVIGRVTRGSLSSDNDQEAKIFNSDINVPLGPFASPDGEKFEIFIVLAKHPAVLDRPTTREVERILFKEWVNTTAREFSIDLL